MLERLYRKDTFEFVVMYGRRRVGKTTLINEFIKGKKAIFYPGIDSNEKQNLELFSNSIMSVASESAVNTVFWNFTDALEYVYEMAQKERLILCGSSLSFMEHQVLGYQSPLYGRRTAQMKILPFTFAECGRYYRNFSKEDLALAYGITGGIPLYMSKVDDKKSIEDNIKDNFFDTSAYLFEEPGNLIKQECREPMQYNAIIKSIATGSAKFNSGTGLCRLICR